MAHRGGWQTWGSAAAVLWAAVLAAWGASAWSGVGALSTAPGGARPGACAPGQVRAEYWTNLPAMSQLMQGVTLTNDSSVACSLPGSPSSVVLQGPTGAPLPAATLRGPSGRGTTRTDFLPYGVPDALSSAPVGLPRSGVSLEPGGRAALLFFGTTGAGLAEPDCMAARHGDELGLHFPGVGTVEASIPSSGVLAGGASFDNPDGSALFSCSPLALSPLLSWPHASRMVGPLEKIVSAWPQLYSAAP